MKRQILIETGQVDPKLGSSRIGALGSKNASNLVVLVSKRVGLGAHGPNLGLVGSSWSSRSIFWVHLGRGGRVHLATLIKRYKSRVPKSL